MRLMTANVRYSAAPDGDNAWEYRKSNFINTILEAKADIIGFQELCEDQFEFVNNHLRSFASYGIYDRTSCHNPLNSIYFKKDKFTLLTASAFYLSATPHIPDSTSWDNSPCPRFANWVLLRQNSSGKEFRFINTHLDHVGNTARINQARLISENSAAFPDELPQFLTGDMNCDATNPAMQMFLDSGWQDTYNAIHKTMTPGLTYHAFQGDNFAGDSITASQVDKMDFVFYRGKASVTNVSIIKKTIDNHYPSDHYFVTADVDLIQD